MKTFLLFSLSIFLIAPACDVIRDKYNICNDGPGHPECPTPCGQCALPTSLCNPETKQCVACLSNADCTDAALPVCDTSTHSCVGCLANSDCKEPTVRCDVKSKTCSRCAADCSANAAAPHCNEASSQCVQCLPAQENTHCGGKSCNPKTFSCTNTPLRMTAACKACVSDSECIQDHRCVPMKFQSTDRPDGYCLKIGSLGCAPPYGVPANNRVSLSGISDTYCGIDETKTTCEAIYDLVNNTPCNNANDCGVDDLNDGLCETVNLMPKICTYACTDSAECTATKLCNGVAPNRYCGAAP